MTNKPEMHITIAYYSMDGHTETVVRDLSQRLNARTIRIEAKKDANRGTKAFKAAMGLTSAIMPCKQDLSDVGFLVIACPVWAKNPPPYVNKFLSRVRNVSGKPFSVLAEMRTAGAETTVGRVRRKLEKKGMHFVSWTSTLQDEVEAGQFSDKVAAFASGIQEYCSKASN